MNLEVAKFQISILTTIFIQIKYMTSQIEDLKDTLPMGQFPLWSNKIECAIEKSAKYNGLGTRIPSFPKIGCGTREWRPKKCTTVRVETKLKIAPKVVQFDFSPHSNCSAQSNAMAEHVHVSCKVCKQGQRFGP